MKQIPTSLTNQARLHARKTVEYAMHEAGIDEDRIFTEILNMLLRGESLPSYYDLAERLTKK